MVFLSQPSVVVINQISMYLFSFTLIVDALVLIFWVSYNLSNEFHMHHIGDGVHPGRSSDSKFCVNFQTDENRNKLWNTAVKFLHKLRDIADCIEESEKVS